LVEYKEQFRTVIELNLAHLKWLGARLSVMSWGERVHRVREQINRFNFNPSMEIENLDISQLSIDRFLNKVDLNYCQAQWKETKKGIRIYGFNWPLKENGSPDWNKFLSGLDTTEIPSFKLTFRNSDYIESDIRLVWEVNRLVWLIPIASYAFLSKDDEAVDFVLKTISDYLDSDRVGYGARWGSSIEAAYQSLSLLILGSIFKDKIEELNLMTSIKYAVTARSKFIRRFPSLFSSANNHRLAELVALIITYANTKANRQNLQELSQELEVRIYEQFDNEGMNCELAFDYHLSSLDLLLATMEFVDLEIIGKNSIERINKVSETTQQIYRLGGLWPIIGDSDMASFLSSVVEYEKKAEWLFEFSGLPLLSSDHKSLTLKNSGYSLVLNKVDYIETLLILDHGPLGFGEIAAHGHADTLGLWLWVDKMPWLIESGTYSYHSSDKFRDFLRSSKMHNAISINNMSTSLPSGPFLWFAKNRAAGKLDSFQADRQEFQIKMSAKIPNPARRNSPYLHKRSVDLKGNRLAVTDEVEGFSNFSLSAHFILNPNFWQARTLNPGQVIYRDQLGNQIAFEFDPKITTPYSDRVKVSGSYGVLEETYRITFKSDPVFQNASQSVTIILSPAQVS
jgi:hypothetical protein